MLDYEVVLYKLSDQTKIKIFFWLEKYVGPYQSDRDPDGKWVHDSTDYEFAKRTLHYKFNSYNDAMYFWLVWK